LLVYDISRETVRTAGTFERSKPEARLGMVAQEDGTYVLVRQRPNGNEWRACRFSFNKHGSVEFSGKVTGHGTVLDDPLLTNRGLAVPVLEKGVQDFILLPPGAFKHDNDHDDDDACEHF